MLFPEIRENSVEKSLARTVPDPIRPRGELQSLWAVCRLQIPHQSRPFQSAIGLDQALPRDMSLRDGPLRVTAPINGLIDYKWVTGVITLLIGVITPYMTCRGKFCRCCSFIKSVVGDSSKEWIFDGGSLTEVERPSEDDLSQVVYFPDGVTIQDF